MSQPALHVTTFNIHKGFSQFNRKMMVHDLRERLRHLNPDIVFLQEVQGLHLRHAESHHNWPSEPQHEFLAEDVWAAFGFMAATWLMTTATTVMPSCRAFRFCTHTIRT